MSYLSIKSIHMLLALASICGFVIRWTWMKTASPLYEHRLTKILPHIIDTLLLTSAIWLAVSIQQYPFTQHWLTAKVIGLVAYIILGSLALKRARTDAGKNMAFFASLLIFVWIISVARTKSAWGIIALLG